MRSPRHAFTLVELSIVLVILGLLVGGVLSGQSLIRAAELRSIVTEKDKYITALNAFRDKYLALPGDMPNAFQFWGTDCGTDTDDVSVGCNGNGNGIIWSYENGENAKVWEHLSRAGLIEGSYDGTGTISPGTPSSVLVDAKNLSKARFSNTFWNIGVGAQEECCGISVNTLAIGSLVNDVFVGPPTDLSHAEAYNLDKKVDDGLSTKGNMRSQAGACYDGSPDGSDPYALLAGYADTKQDCTPTFILR